MHATTALFSFMELLLAKSHVSRKMQNLLNSVEREALQPGAKGHVFLHKHLNMQTKCPFFRFSILKGITISFL